MNGNNFNELFDYKAEFTAIGLCFKDIKNLIAVSQHLDAEDFFDSRHKVIIREIFSLHAKGHKVEIALVSQNLGERLQEAGGYSYLIDFEVVCSAFFIADEIEAIKNKSNLRKALDISVRMQKDIHLFNNPKEFISKYYDQMSNIILGSAEDTLISHADQMKKSSTSKKNRENIERKKLGLSTHAGIPTNFYDLDKLIHGFRKGNLIVIGARPGMGKTTLLLNFIRKMNIIPLFFTLEMTVEDLADKLNICNANANLSEHINGTSSPKESDKIYLSEKDLIQKNIYYDSNSYTTPNYIKSRLKQLVKMHGVNCVFIDYIQLMHSDKRGLSTYDEITNISHELKKIARDFGITLIALSQVARESKGDALSIFLGSGALEADCDIAIALDRANSAAKDKYETDNEIELKIIKNRHGNKGIVKLNWNGATGVIENSYTERYYN